MYSELYRNDSIAFIILHFIASLLLLGLSKHTFIIRKQHMDSITHRKNSFGIEKEKFDRLKIIKGSLKNSFKFYVINVIMMNVFSSIEVYELVFTKFHYDIKLIVALLSQCADTMVVSLSYREIRLQFKRVISRCIVLKFFNHSQVDHIH